MARHDEDRASCVAHKLLRHAAKKRVAQSAITVCRGDDHVHLRPSTSPGQSFHRRTDFNLRFTRDSKQRRKVHHFVQLAVRLKDRGFQQLRPVWISRRACRHHITGRMNDVQEQKIGADRGCKNRGVSHTFSRAVGEIDRHENLLQHDTFGRGLNRSTGRFADYEDGTASLTNNFLGRSLSNV